VHGGRFRTVFSVTLEDQLCEYLMEMSARGFGMTQQQVCAFAYELAEKNKLEHNFDRNLKRAGRDWFDSFLHRHRGLSIRSSEATRLGRIMGFNRPQVNQFFDVLATAYAKHNFGASRIYNCDESGLPTVPTKLPKVLAAKGTKRVAKVTSAERGTNVTFVCCMNASGSFIPPAFLFARKKMTERLMIGAPADAVGIVTDSGWMTSDAFVRYLQHIAKHARPTKEDPIMLILDNHSSHIALQAIEFCREKGIVMISIPPHCTHRLQPLDISFFGPMKTYYSRACDSWMAHHPGQAITEYHVASLANGAYQKAATVASAVSGFCASGIYPFDRDVFSDADFSAAETTERPIAAHPSAESSAPSAVTVHSGEVPVDVAVDNGEVPAPSSISSESSSSPSAVAVHSGEVPAPNSINSESASASYAVVSNSDISPLQLRPYPSAQRSSSVKKRTIVRAQILTSTPYKNQLIAQQEAKDKKKNESKRCAKSLVFTPSLPAKRLKKQPVKRAVNEHNPTAADSDTTPCLFCEIAYCDSNVQWFQCKNCSNWVCGTCSGKPKKSARRPKGFVCANCK
jgi:hypothetical protein